MGNKISKFSCGLINKNGNSNNGLIVANSRASSEKNSSDKNSSDSESINLKLLKIVRSIYLLLAKKMS